MTLNEVIHEATEVKLNRLSSGSWTTDDSAANLAGKQGAKRPPSSSISPSTAPPVSVDPDIPAYCYKPTDLTFKEVQNLMRRFSCPLCRRNGHPLHECSSLSHVYNISPLKIFLPPSQQTINPTSRHQPPPHRLVQLPLSPPIVLVTHFRLPLMIRRNVMMILRIFSLHPPM